MAARDIQIGITLQVFGADQVVADLRKVNKELMEMMAYSTVLTKRGLAPTVEAMGDLRGRAREAGEYLRGLGLDTKESYRAFKDLETATGLVTDRTKTAMQYLRSLLREEERRPALLTDAVLALKKVAAEQGLTTEEQRRALTALGQYRIQTMEATIANDILRHSIGASGRAWRSLGRALFWAGLGTMFLTMSIARANRALFAITVAQRSYQRALERVDIVQEEYNRILWEYGPASLEARRAALRLKEAQDSVRMAQWRVREATEGYILSIFMLGLGAMPTVIRAISDITAGLTAVISSKIAAAVATGVMSKQEAMLAVALIKDLSWTEKVNLARAKEITLKTIATKATTAYTASKWAAVKATLALALASGKGIAILAMFAAGMGLAWYMVDKFQREAMDLDRTLTRRSLIDSFIAVRKEVDKLSDSLKELPLRGHSPIEIRTRYGWVNIGPEPRVAPLVAPGVGDINITIHGPWYIREEADIEKIAKEISRAQMRSLRYRTGGRI